MGGSKVKREIVRGMVGKYKVRQTRERSPFLATYITIITCVNTMDCSYAGISAAPFHTQPALTFYVNSTNEPDSTYSLNYTFTHVR